MLEPDTNFFLMVPDGSSQRVLRPATVVDLTGDSCTAELKGQGHSFEEGMDILLYRDFNRRFVQQAVRIQSVDLGQEGTRVSFTTLGDPVSAESRECYRVSALDAAITATFGPEDDCRILDVSATGFGVLASATYGVGIKVDVVVHFEDEDHIGNVMVQGAQQWGPNKIRYGVFCLDDRKPGASLKASLPAINLAIQRQQLQRIARYR